MKTVPVHEAKTNLSKLIQRACDGEDIVISRGRTPVVRLVPVDAKPPARRFGAMRGTVTVDDSFFEPLADEELDAWE